VSWRGLLFLRRAVELLQSNLKNKAFHLFPCTLQNIIGFGNDIGICKIKIKKIKSKHSIKNCIHDHIFLQTPYRKSPTHATILVSSILTFDVSGDTSPLSVQSLDLYSGNGCPLNGHIIHPSTQVPQRDW